MSEIDIAAEWQVLCDQHEAAKNAYYQAFGAVNQRFSAIGRGVSTTNPDEQMLSAFDATWLAWEDVKQRMDAFVKTHA